MILSVINGILDKLREFGVARHYGFAELIPDGESLIPSIYCSNGEYRHVVDGYEWSEGIAYIRMAGKDSSEQVEGEMFVGCQDLISITQPLMLVVIGKRKGYRNFEMGELIRAKVGGLYPTLAQSVGAVFVDVDVRGIDYDISTILSSEFEGASISWDTGNYIIAVDMDVVVRIDAKCLSNADPCDINAIAVNVDNDLASDSDTTLTY
jgi:hypothetical protein